jgi:hypothetical protein
VVLGTYSKLLVNELSLRHFDAFDVLMLPNDMWLWEQKTRMRPRGLMHLGIHHSEMTALGAETVSHAGSSQETWPAVTVGRFDTNAC